MPGGNSTIDISTITTNNMNANHGSGFGLTQLFGIQNNSSDEYPRIKEVWRWIRALLSGYLMQLQTIQNQTILLNGSPAKGSPAAVGSP